MQILPNPQDNSSVPSLTSTGTPAGTDHEGGGAGSQALESFDDPSSLPESSPKIVDRGNDAAQSALILHRYHKPKVSVRTESGSLSLDTGNENDNGDSLLPLPLSPIVVHSESVSMYETTPHVPSRKGLPLESPSVIGIAPLGMPTRYVD